MHTDFILLRLISYYCCIYTRNVKMLLLLCMGKSVTPKHCAYTRLFSGFLCFGWMSICFATHISSEVRLPEKVTRTLCLLRVPVFLDSAHALSTTTRILCRSQPVYKGHGYSIAVGKPALPSTELSVGRRVAVVKLEKGVGKTTLTHCHGTTVMMRNLFLAAYVII